MVDWAEDAEVEELDEVVAGLVEVVADEAVEVVEAVVDVVAGPLPFTITVPVM